MSDEYIRKADAIRWIKTECNPYGKPTLDFESGKKVFEHLEQMPPADVVQVVRCKDCKHHNYDEIFGGYWCEYPGRVRDTTPDGFCEKGEE